MPTPLAERELREYRDRFGTATSSFLYHYARLIEILAGVEGIAQAIDDPDVLSDRLRAHAGVNQLEGVGVSEAPRGTLFHHYQVDENGLMKRVNLIIATGQNDLAMNRTVKQIAQHYIKGPEIPEGILNRLEAGIRAFDPCLSCSTHAVGMMPLHVQLDRPRRLRAERSLEELTLDGRERLDRRQHPRHRLWQHPARRRRRGPARGTRSSARGRFPA